MNEIDILKDILEYKISLQTWYNHAMLDVINPEARALFTRLRDDESRAVLNIQQKLMRMEAPNRIAHKILPVRNRA